VLTHLDTQEWRGVVGRAPTALRADFRDALLDIAARHWDSNIQEAAHRVREKYGDAAPADRKRRGAIAVVRSAGQLGPLAGDRFVDGWTAVVKSGAGKYQGLDQPGFLRAVAQVSLRPGDENEFGNKAVNFRGLRSRVCESLNTFVSLSATTGRFPSVVLTPV
jgi:hypothetical protein